MLEVDVTKLPPLDLDALSRECVELARRSGYIVELRDGRRAKVVHGASEVLQDALGRGWSEPGFGVEPRAALFCEALAEVDELLRRESVDVLHLVGEAGDWGYAPILLEYVPRHAREAMS